MENLHLKLEGVNGNELIIREGDALPQIAPKKVDIKGDIKSVASFIGKRNPVTINGGTAGDEPGAQYINKNRAIVEVDRKSRTIVLSLDPQDPNGTVVTSKLEPNPDLEQFSINGKKQFSQKDLVTLLKFSRLYFEDFDQHGSLLRAYTSFSAKTTADLSNEKDSRGNKAMSFHKKVETGLPETFIMNIPIFKGQIPKRFRVEICLDVTDSSVAFWFESVELAEMMEIEGEAIIKAELDSCKDFVIVYK